MAELAVTVRRLYVVLQCSYHMYPKKKYYCPSPGCSRSGYPLSLLSHRGKAGCAVTLRLVRPPRRHNRRYHLGPVVCPSISPSPLLFLLTSIVSAKSVVRPNVSFCPISEST